MKLLGRDIAVVPPSWQDPRLRLSAVVMVLQVLGQVALGFKLSIAQILVSIGICVAIEVPLTLWRENRLAWPASAMLTANSVAFILRAAGTRHGDWWSLHGIQFFAVACVIAMASKYLIRVRGRHLLNPSNVGLVATFLAFGVFDAFPQYLSWGDLGWGVILADAVIALGGLWVCLDLRMWPMVASFLAVLGLGVAAGAVAGHCFVAIWSPLAICGASYWQYIVLSPETLVFALFMMTDPRTTPTSTPGRAWFGGLTGGLAAVLLAFQPAEFGVKVAILTALTVCCVVAPLLDRAPADRSPRVSPFWRLDSGPTRLAWIALVVTIVVPVALGRVALDQSVTNLESRAPGSGATTAQP